MRVEEEEAEAGSLAAGGGGKKGKPGFSRAVRGETRRDSSDAEAAACSLSPPLQLALSSSLAHTRQAQARETESASTGMAETTRAQFEQQEDFISFDASPPPQPQPPQLQSASTSNARKRRISDRHGPAPQDNDDEDDQQQGTRRLRDRERARSTPWCLDPGVDWARYARATDQLNAEAHAFVRYISPTPLEHELRLHTIELIRRTVRSKYPDSDVECFGSVGTGLYLPGGDIDLVVLSPSMPSPPLKPSSSLLHRLASLLLTSSIAAPQSLVVIAKARVPIVKFTTRYGGFSVDLSVNQKNGIDAAVRVRSILEEYAFREEGYVEPGAAASGLSIKGKGKGKATGGEEEGGKVDDAQTLSHPVDHGVARSLVLLVKAFLSQRGMNEVFTGGLGSYSIICMVVSFLQVRAPCLSLLLTGWQTTETNNLLLSSSGDTPLSLSRGQLHPRIQTAQINPNRNIGLLFVEFLELYGKHFNYDQPGSLSKVAGVTLTSTIKAGIGLSSRTSSVSKTRTTRVSFPSLPLSYPPGSVYSGQRR